MDLKLVIPFFIILSVGTLNQHNLCKKIEVQGANYAGCSGVYLINNEFKVEWAKDKAVYRHVKMDRFLFFNVKPYYWCIGKQTYLRTKQFFYYSGINEEEPFSRNNTWKTRAEESNVSVLCFNEPKDKILTLVKEDNPSRIIKECGNIAKLWTIWKIISIALLALVLPFASIIIVFKLTILFLNKYHSEWRNQ